MKRVSYSVVLHTARVFALVLATATAAAPETPDYLQYDTDTFTPLTLGVPTDPLSLVQGQHMMFTFDVAADADADEGVPMTVHCTTTYTTTISREAGDTDSNVIDTNADAVTINQEHIGMHLYSADNSQFFREGSLSPGVDKDLHLVVYPGYTAMVVELVAETDVTEEQSGLVLWCEATPVTQLAFNAPSEPFDFTREAYREIFLLDTRGVGTFSNPDPKNHESEEYVIYVTCNVVGNSGNTSLLVYELHADYSFKLVGSSRSTTARQEEYSFVLSPSATMLTVAASNVGFGSNFNNRLTCRTALEVDGNRYDPYNFGNSGTPASSRVYTYATLAVLTLLSAALL